MYNHDDLVFGFIELEEKRTYIHPRPITYSVEPTPFEEYMLKLLMDDPIMECQKLWLRTNPYVKNLVKS